MNIISEWLKCLFDNFSNKNNIELNKMITRPILIYGSRYLAYEEKQGNSLRTLYSKIRRVYEEGVGRDSGEGDRTVSFIEHSRNSE